MATFTASVPIVNGIAKVTVEAANEEEAKKKIAAREFTDVGNAEWDVDETKYSQLRKQA